VLIDTHCHLDAAEFDGDRDQIASAALAAGVERIVVPAVAVDNFPQVKTVIQRYPACRAAYGIHPLYVAKAREDDLEQLKHWLETENPIAVGEIGLDYYLAESDTARQMQFFTEQLKLARARQLPVLLHVRRAIDPILAQLRRIRVPGGIAHAFNGSRQQAEEFIKLGFKLGFGGALTYSGSTRIRALAASWPLEHLVLETDAPDIPPSWLNRRRNSPAELPKIAAALAELRHESVEEIAEKTSASARQVLPCL
jgi:TatD DNase family protein